MEDVIKWLAEEQSAIEKNIQPTQSSLTELGYKILRELNNDKNFGFYSRGQDGQLKKFPSHSLGVINKQIDLHVETVNDQLKILFVKRYIDFDLVLIDRYKKIQEVMPSLNEDLLKYGTKLDNGFKDSDSFRLTDRGLMALIDHSLNEVDKLESNFKASLIKQEKQIDQLSELSSQVEIDLTKVNSDVEETRIKIGRFNENIFTIFSLMIAAFAVIGINISSIPNIQGDFLVNVLAINLSVSFSLIVLFFLLKILIQKEKKSGLGLLLIGFGLLLLAFTYLVLG